MAFDQTRDVDGRVVVVGAGPAGLVATITLARMGVRCLLVDRRRAPSELPRATVLSLHTMELLRSWGLENRVQDGGHDVEWLMSLSRTLREAGLGDRVEVGYPTIQQSAVISPSRPANVPQDHLESVLLDHVRRLPAAQVRLGVHLENIERRGTGYRVVLRDELTGAVEVERAAFVLGADGAHSTVRDLLGIAMPTSGSHYEALSVVLHGPLWDLVGDHRYGIYVVDGDAAATFLPAGHPDRWVYSFGWDPTHERLADYSPARLLELVRVSAGDPSLSVRLGRIGAFSFVGGIAGRYRDGRAFLLGDAAHRVTPRGGTGLNTAVADGFDLGWKLAWVMRGWTDESLLGSYEVERRPVAEHNLNRSLDPIGSRRSVIGEVHVDLGPRLPHLWLPSDGRHPDGGRRSTLDLLTTGLTVITADADAAVAATTQRTGVTAPVTVWRLDRMTARAVGAGPTGSVLRPDGIAVAPAA